MKTLKIFKRFFRLKWEEFCDFFSNFNEHLHNNHLGAIFITGCGIILITFIPMLFILHNEVAIKWAGIICGWILALLILALLFIGLYLFFEWLTKLIISNYKEAKRQIEAETKKKRRKKK